MFYRKRAGKKSGKKEREMNETGYWLIFFLVAGVVIWYIREIIYCPYWSKEPVLHTYDWMRQMGVLNSTWKRGMSSHKYLDVGGVRSWKAGEAGYSGAVEKMGGFLRREWIVGVGDISGGGLGDGMIRTFTLSSAELEKGAGRGAVVSSFSLLKYPTWDASFRALEDISGGCMDGGSGMGDGWMLSYPVYYWFSDSGMSCGGVLGELFGCVGGRERSGETWKVDYLCIRRSLEKKDQLEVVRKLFTTHLYRLVFPSGGVGGSYGIRNSALFHGDPSDESMQKVVPVVRFRVVEVELDEKEVWPLYKRWVSGRKKWQLMGGKEATVMENRLLRNWLEGWYSGGGGSGGNGGAMGGFRMVGVATLSMWLDKMASGDWFVWVLFRPLAVDGDGIDEGGWEIEAVLCFRNEHCLIEGKNEIRGMAGSGTEVFSLMGSWFLSGVSLEEGREIFRRGLREMRRFRKSFRVLRVDMLGYNVELMDALRVSGGGNGLMIGRVVKQDWMAYYFYNRFCGEVEARKCFVIL